VINNRPSKIMLKVSEIENVNNDFFKVPVIVNKKMIHFIPAFKMDVRNVLNSKKNPFWAQKKRKMLIVYKSNKPIARGIVHIGINHQGLPIEDIASFGFLEFTEDKEVFNLLMENIISWAKENGAKAIKGPFNPSINYELGVLTKGYDLEPSFMMTYNPEYYSQFYESLGFQEDMKFFAYQVPNYVERKKIDRVVALLKDRRGAKIGEVDFSNFKNAALELCSIYNDAFSQHYGFIPFSEDEFLYLAKDLKFIMNKKLIFKVMIGDETAGFIMALPNMNEVIKTLNNGKLGIIGLINFFLIRKKIKKVKVMVAAVRKKYQHLGLGSLLYAEMADRVKNGGYEGGELSWVAADNIKMNEMILEMGGTIEKEYKVFKLDINIYNKK
jgi:hypothetical protein